MQRLFYFDDKFDRAMIYFIRKLTKNFITKHQDLSFNDLPLKHAPAVEKIDVPEAATLEGYFREILMNMDEDA